MSSRPCRVARNRWKYDMWSRSLARKTALKPKNEGLEDFQSNGMESFLEKSHVGGNTIPLGYMGFVFLP